ncbi:F-box/LRR-repeat protein At3g26922-like [Corylus avellana]|uniref:F-box/LRR-repeat protein At3g26922-like n=1 Tax=Corylus avellana TaxID=13451 RepID=UPI00286C2EDE|nr:F-box/LRR-repeat protein At3g26922-like [Corylus avellana]
METTSVIHKPQKKNQKLNEEEDIDETSKSLGNLPEEILRHILSFLPTKDAVGTSVLSKRWEYLWDSIPNLDFNLYGILRGKRKRKRTLFMNFVDRVLCLRDSYDIKRFALCCDVLHDASRVHTWISAAIKHNVQDLNIDLEIFIGEFSLPYCLFTCETLISLHLYMSGILKLPTKICFSNLKVLTMDNVTFSDDYLTQQFFSGLPVLEKLKLYLCGWRNLKVVRISSPKLQFLSVVDFERPDLSNGEGCQVMISGVRLKEFHYRGLLLGEYRLYESFKLEKAEIELHESQADAHDRMHKLLAGLSNVQFLKLSSEVVMVLIHAEELLTNMPTFNNLKDLELNGTSFDLDCEALLKILQSFPCLENLKILRDINLLSSCEEDDRILCPVPPCFLSHLKWIKVNRYDVDEKKLSAIKFLLKKAIVLEEVVISSVNVGGNLEKQLKAFSITGILPSIDVAVSDIVLDATG